VTDAVVHDPLTLGEAAASSRTTVSTSVSGYPSDSADNPLYVCPEGAPAALAVRGIDPAWRICLKPALGAGPRRHTAGKRRPPAPLPGASRREARAIGEGSWRRPAVTARARESCRGSGPCHLTFF
jgi:hypothetical protein